MNVDAGTMAPTEHGECFVLDDGGEVDLDLGNYERYLNVTLTKENSITTGKMYQHVIERERRGDYLGKTVQVVPHLTNAIQDWIERVARISVDDTNEEPDVCIIELGGTVGDIESGPFIEAMRQLRRRAGRDNFCHIHVSLVPVVGGEQKTKPTQQAIRDARSAGLAPDLIACRCQERLIEATTHKIAMFCQVEPSQVIGVHDVESTYHVPLLLEQQGILSQVHDLFRLEAYPISPALVKKGQQTWNDWKALTTSQERFLESEKVTIALVGKYTNLHDSYLSVIKSLEHSAMACRRKLNLVWVDASNLEKATMESSPESFHKAWHELCTADGVLVPGGFGHRGTEGMIAAANWARTKPKPYLGICLGMQIAVIEFARNVCGMKEASSVELDPQTPDPVVIFMPEIDKTTMGGNMRLGLRPTIFQDDTEWSRLRKLYNNAPSVNERHRHRYEVNPGYISRLSDAGLPFIGKDDLGERMEIIELEDHPFFVGVQFHPEYLSRVLRPSPPYLGFVAASAGLLDQATAATAAKAALMNGDSHHAGKVNGVVTNGVSKISLSASSSGF
ncbi:CTP synthase [Rhinocladiella mackenziei CBS 650.93]|uniref:CTP synthase n=1 Tax=Rhinocladiella mackenziei CBS 650.93 TaxID=1442369 RepID=A0A0D2J4A3_9EURO|nr:CTP synthase [Rhinocladiella mackenziei CBS 650.93]KIX03845.1 CTP synthase [Rhinocladiella mackenziei CBS 650.93]